MIHHSNSQNNLPNTNWKSIVLPYQKSSLSRSIWQLTNTLVPYILLWVAMYFLKDISWWLVFPLAVLAGGFMVRTFIIFHDCCHGSYFQSRRANTICGYICGILTFTPYHQWRWEHNIHHATSGNLDRRGLGDISTMTTEEYLAASFWKKLAYRLTRNPIVLFGFAPSVLFLLWQRVPNFDAPKREKLSVLYTNIGILVVFTPLVFVFGWKAFLFILLTIMICGGAVGVWLFYVQHQFAGVYWSRNKNWSYVDAALQGSSFYKLPKILQWFSGNIGFHHIHHLSSRIPNYYLEKCHKAEPLFNTVEPLTFFKSFKSSTYRLWDEKRKELISYRRFRKLQKEKRYYKNNEDDTNPF